LVGNITAIDIDVLKGASPGSLSIATRMSWASQRSTSRVEDTAYCLLGLFDVHMPMLYGEGHRSFIRLQEEIMKYSDDHSIFAWTDHDPHYRGLLATSPTEFRGCGNIIRVMNRERRTPYSMTNIGISIQLRVVPWTQDLYAAVLDCVDSGCTDQIAIFLKALRETDQFARTRYGGEDKRRIKSTDLPELKYRTLYVRQTIWESPSIEQFHGFWLRTIPYSLDPDVLSSTLAAVSTWHIWNSETRILQIPVGQNGTAGVVWYSQTPTLTLNNFSYSYLEFGFDDMFRPVVEFDGNLWRFSPTTTYFAPHPSDFWANMRSSHKSHAITGDKAHGINMKVIPRGFERMTNIPIHISVVDEVRNNQKIWVVDITGRKGVYLTDPSASITVSVAPYQKEQLKPPYRHSQISDSVGDGVQHFNIVSDLCDQAVRGIRYRCLSCPNFDSCDQCITSAATTHPDHQFEKIDVPIVQSIDLTKDPFNGMIVSMGWQEGYGGYWEYWGDREDSVK
jgi:hypothetical protein